MTPGPGTADLQSAALRDDPYVIFRGWRSHGPVLFREARNDWLVIGHRAVTTALRDPRFGNGEPVKTPPTSAGCPRVGDAYGLMLTAGANVMADWPLMRDPPFHQRLRQPFVHLEHMLGVAWIEGRVAKLVDESLAGRAATDIIDGVSELARPLTFSVSCDMLGIPLKDRPALSPLIDKIGDGIDVDVSAAQVHQGLLAAAAARTYADRLFDRPAEHGLLARLAEAVEAGSLDRSEAVALSVLSLLAGFRTSEALLSSSLYHLLGGNESWATLAAGGEVLDGAVEECLRFDGPVHHVPRTALCDAELEGQSVKAGQTLRLLLGAANRDPAAFIDPDRFNPDRARGQVLAMGLGIHSCPGGGLARHVVKAAIRHLSATVPQARRLASPVSWRKGFQIRSLAALPITLGGG